MKGQTSKGLRILLLVYAIYMAIYGLGHVLMPGTLGPLDPATTVLFGLAVLVFVIGALLAYREKTWEKVRIVVLMQVVWMILYTIGFVWGLASGGIPAEAMMFGPPIIGGIFAILFLIFYFRERKMQRQ
jgi:hypothetical protein